MGALADCIMEVYALESCILRAEKLIAAKGEAAAKQAIAMTRYYAAKADRRRWNLSSRKVIAAVAEGDMLRTQMAILRRLSKHEPADTIGLGRQIAKHVLAAGKYAATVAAGSRGVPRRALVPAAPSTHFRRAKASALRMTFSRISHASIAICAPSHAMLVLIRRSASSNVSLRRPHRAPRLRRPHPVQPLSRLLHFRSDVLGRVAARLGMAFSLRDVLAFGILRRGLRLQFAVRLRQIVGPGGFHAPVDFVQAAVARSAAAALSSSR